MTRKSSIRSLCILAAAPSLVCEVGKESDILLLDKVPKPHSPQTIKIAAYWKVCSEMLKDDNYMDWLFSCESDFFRKFFEAGADISKPYTIKIGYENDDFSRNLKTVVISQYV